MSPRANLADTYPPRLRRALLQNLREMGIADERVLDAMDRVPLPVWTMPSCTSLTTTRRFGLVPARPSAIRTRWPASRNTGPAFEPSLGDWHEEQLQCKSWWPRSTASSGKGLYDAHPLLKQQGYQARSLRGRYKGKTAFAPFDGILVTCGAPRIPEALLGQLAVGGRLIIPLDDPEAGEGKQTMTEVKRVDETHFTRRTHGTFAFVPMLAARSGAQG